MKKLVLHIPHSSTIIPFNNGYILSNEIIQNEILKLTDWYTDDLFSSEIDDRIVAKFSRIFCDPERFEEDKNEPMSKKGMGVLYEKTDTGEIMREITPELREKIINEYYRKHHQKLNDAVNQQLVKYGKAIIIDCHSMSDIPFIRDINQESIRTDYSVGIDHFHTNEKLHMKTLNFFLDRGIEVAINSPYSGTLVPMEHYKRNKNVQSIMIEVNRKLYLKDNSNVKSENYPAVKRLLQNYLDEIRKLL
jgi:N-formylglutamate amidohydrolase